MRIIAGEWKGRRLEVPPGIRPMLDRERERLFGVIGERVLGAEFLDVFAGSGAIGLEALSRGASGLVAVENGRRVLPVLERNLEALHAGRRARLVPISAFGLHRSGICGPGSVGIASCAPPFPLFTDPALRGRFAALFSYIQATLLGPEGLLVVEHPRELDPAGATGLGPPQDTRRTAASAISFWEYPKSAAREG